MLLSHEDQRSDPQTQVEAGEVQLPELLVPRRQMQEVPSSKLAS